MAVWFYFWNRGSLCLTRKTLFFGVRIGSYVYSYTTFAANVAAALSNVLIGYIYDFTGTYVPIFWAAIGIQLMAGMLLFVAIKFAPVRQDTGLDTGLE